MNKAETQKRPSWIVRAFRSVVVFFSGLIVLIVAVAMVFGAFSKKEDRRPEPTAPRVASPAPAPPPQPAAPKQPEHRVITKDEMDAVLASMNQYQGVRESRIVQEGKTFKLALSVSLGVTEAEARDLGDSFVRQVKGIIDDTQPTKTIGMGSFSYWVIVGTNGNKVLAQGEKWPESESIRWK